MADGAPLFDSIVAFENFPAEMSAAAELTRTVRITEVRPMERTSYPLTLQVTKEAMRRLQARLADENIDDLIRHTYGSADFREGMDAFLDKRPPRWTGR